MNIIAVMGPHGVFYKDEPIKELEQALQSRGYQLIWPHNSADLLKFIEHNPRICGVIFDWDEYDLELCSDINRLNEYLPLYALLIPTQPWTSAPMICVWRCGSLNIRSAWLKILRPEFSNTRMNISITSLRPLPARSSPT